CCLNVPAAAFDVDGGVTGRTLRETLQLDAGSSSDLDNAVLLVPTDGGPVSGCGLNQALTYTWSGFVDPGAVAVTFIGSNGTTNPGQSFTLDTNGLYTIQVTVDDGKNA